MGVDALEELEEHRDDSRLATQTDRLPEIDPEIDLQRNASIVEVTTQHRTAPNPRWTEPSARAGSATRSDTSDAIARRRRNKR